MCKIETLNNSINKLIQRVEIKSTTFRNWFDVKNSFICVCLDEKINSVNENAKKSQIVCDVEQSNVEYQVVD